MERSSKIIAAIVLAALCVVLLFMLFPDMKSWVKIGVGVAIPLLFLTLACMKRNHTAEEPETPIVDPETPVTEPETPIVDPETPVTEPETSVVDPETPVVDPETPIVDPETPVTEPE